jgi:hypothetical protein
MLTRSQRAQQPVARHLTAATPFGPGFEGGDPAARIEAQAAEVSALPLSVWAVLHSAFDQISVAVASSDVSKNVSAVQGPRGLKQKSELGTYEDQLALFFRDDRALIDR